jgi:hypothetical protein
MSEPTVDESFVGIDPRIVHELGDLLGRRWQAKQIEGQPPNEHRAVGEWRWGESRRSDFFQQEQIDRRSRPIRPGARPWHS